MGRAGKPLLSMHTVPESHLHRHRHLLTPCPQGWVLVMSSCWFLFLLSPSPMAFSAFSQFPQNTYFSSIFIEHLFMCHTTVDTVMSCPDHFSRVEDLLLRVRMAESPQLPALSGELPQREKTSPPNFTPPLVAALSTQQKKGRTHCLRSGRLCRVPSSRMWG